MRTKYAARIREGIELARGVRTTDTAWREEIASSQALMWRAYVREVWRLQWAEGTNLDRVSLIRYDLWEMSPQDRKAILRWGRIKWVRGDFLGGTK